MKIAVNLIPHRGYTGIGVYTRNILENLIAQFPDDEFVLIKDSKLPDIWRFEGKNVSEYVIPVRSSNKILLMLLQQGLPAILKKNGADVLFTTSPTGPVFYRNKIVTVHDCAYRIFDEFRNPLSKFVHAAMLWSAKARAREVIAISEFAKNDFIDAFHADSKKIHVVHSGLPKLFAVDESSVDRTLGTFKLERGKYFFYIGNTRPRKNILGMLWAFKKFSEKHLGYRFVVAGKIERGFFDISKQIENMDLGSAFMQIDYVSDEEKVALYKGSLALVFASFYEGFGFPVLEAQSLGVPVITSQSSSLSEIAGGGALFIDPHKPGEIAAAMVRVAEDGELRKNLIARGLENVKRFPWSKTAEATMAVLRQAARK